MQNKIMILIPAYQEGGRIGIVVQDARMHGDVVVVDDGSLDRTAEEALAQGAHVIRHGVNQGKGGAIQTGFGYFLKGSWEYLILLDGDGQHLTSEIPQFIKAAESPRVMMIVGNRMGETGKMPFIRIATNWVMSRILSMMAGVPVPDTQCGYRLMKRGLIERIHLESMRFDIESEILVEAGRITKEIVSIPIQTVYGDEKSKIRPVRDTIRFFKFIYRSMKRK